MCAYHAILTKPELYKKSFDPEKMRVKTPRPSGRNARWDPP